MIVEFKTNTFRELLNPSNVKTLNRARP